MFLRNPCPLVFRMVGRFTVNRVSLGVSTPRVQSNEKVLARVTELLSDREKAS